MYRGDLMPCCHGDLSTGVDINFDALHKYEGKITVKYKETNIQPYSKQKAQQKPFLDLFVKVNQKVTRPTKHV